LQGLATGAGAGVQPLFTGPNAGNFKQELGSEVLHLKVSVEERVALGQIGLGENFKGLWQKGRALPRPTSGGKIFGHGVQVALQAQPQPGAAVEGVDLSRRKGLGAFRLQPDGSSSSAAVCST
jgi:hypothetical protein